MKPEIKKAIQTELNQKVKEALESSDFFEKLKANEMTTLRDELIADGKYKLHKGTRVVNYGEEVDTDTRTITLKNPKWETPYHVSEARMGGQIRNLSMFYFTGDVEGDITCTWKYNEDGDLEVSVPEITIDTNFEKKRSN